ncbi:MAG: hypothetical protein JJU00_09995 [Opitutales bacterium]|nr:hypothetical protein [Opitutales bacterium]
MKTNIHYVRHALAACLSLGLAATSADARSIAVSTDTYDPDFPGSAFGWTLREPHLDNPTDFVDFGIMGAVDWLIPNNSGTLGPGVLDRMASERVFIEALEPTGFSSSGAHHQWDAWIVPFLFDNAELIGSTPDPEFGYWATSWIGDESGGNAEWIFRVNVDADSLQVWHWWNHGLGNYQLATASLHDAAGNELDSRVIREYNSTAPAQFTTVIDVSGQEAGDYLLISHRGTNVGWRGSAILPGDSGGVDPGPDIGIYEEFPVSAGWADTGAWLGRVFVEGYPWVYFETMDAHGYALGEWTWLVDTESHLIVEVSDGWVFFAEHGVWAYESGPWYYFAR